GAVGQLDGVAADQNRFGGLRQAVRGGVGVVLPVADTGFEVVAEDGAHVGGGVALVGAAAVFGLTARGAEAGIGVVDALALGGDPASVGAGAVALSADGDAVGVTRGRSDDGARVQAVVAVAQRIVELA